ncbi:hypothetical protein [Streptomyces crystallinus]|uniref:hypothetical protein n=1 Tax=Streptomyces crystallinus TaxID=68191 RepID=UPI0031E37F91
MGARTRWSIGWLTSTARTSTPSATGPTTWARSFALHYLTDDLRQRLAAWEEANHADGVLRAQDVPTQWEVRYHDSGAGHLFTTITLTWGTGRTPGTPGWRFRAT